MSNHNKKYDKYGFRFRKWDIYKDARTFRTKINKLVSSYPREEKYALSDQTRRALNSIILNIAEGANKESNKEMKLYISRSSNSLDEVVACLDCALDSQYITSKQHDKALTDAESLAKRLKAFITKIARDN